MPGRSAQLVPTSCHRRNRHLAFSNHQSGALCLLARARQWLSPGPLGPAGRLVLPKSGNGHPVSVATLFATSCESVFEWRRSLDSSVGGGRQHLCAGRWPPPDFELNVRDGRFQGQVFLSQSSDRERGLRRPGVDDGSSGGVCWCGFQPTTPSGNTLYWSSLWVRMAVPGMKTWLTRSGCDPSIFSSTPGLVVRCKRGSQRYLSIRRAMCDSSVRLPARGHTLGVCRSAMLRLMCWFRWWLTLGPFSRTPVRWMVEHQVAYGSGGLERFK